MPHPPQPKKRCYIMMPFSETTEKHTEEYWTKHYTDFLKPLVEQNPSIEVFRSKPIRGDIIKQIVSDLITSPLAIADITDMNPNVFWELGVRQSFRNGTITIAEGNLRLPFDLSPKGTLFYSDDHIKNAKFRNDLKQALEDCISFPETPDSSVLEAISGRGTLYAIIHGQEAIRKIEALIDEVNWNIHLLERISQKVAYNERNPTHTSWITSRFMEACLELLLTSRYLDGHKTLYIRAKIGFTSCLALNGQLNNRHLHRKRTEKWLKKFIPMYTKRFKDVQDSLKEVYSELKEKSEYLL
jgi:hypothetical protein